MSVSKSNKQGFFKESFINKNKYLKNLESSFIIYLVRSPGLGVPALCRLLPILKAQESSHAAARAGSEHANGFSSGNFLPHYEKIEVPTMGATSLSQK